MLLQYNSRGVTNPCNFIVTVRYSVSLRGPLPTPQNLYQPLFGCGNSKPIAVGFRARREQNSNVQLYYPSRNSLSTSQPASRRRALTS